MRDAGGNLLPLEDMGSGNGGHDGGRGHGGRLDPDGGHGHGGSLINVSYMSINSYFRYYFQNLIVLCLYFLAT